MVTVVGALLPPPLPVLPGTWARGRDGGLETVRVAEPVPAMSLAGIVSVICEAVIVAAEPEYWMCDAPRFQFTVEDWAVPERKLLPVMVSGRSADGGAHAGETKETDGMGLAGLLTMKVMVLERPVFPAPEAGLTVRTVATPGLAMSAAGTTALTLLPRAAPVLSTATVV